MSLSLFSGRKGAVTEKNHGNEVNKTSTLTINNNFSTKNKYSFTAVVDDNMALNFGTEWEEGPGAKLMEKVRGFVNTNAYKVLAGSNYNALVATDGLTQKVVKNANPISISVKFRAYRTDFQGTSDYVTIFSALLTMCMPHKLQLGNLFDNISATIDNARSFGNQLGGLITSNEDVVLGDENDKKKDSAQVKASLRKSLGDIKADDKDDKNEKTLTDIIDDTLNKTLLNNYVANDPYFEKCFMLGFSGLIRQNPKYLWVLKNFKMTPSVQVEGMKPLWLDFECSFETNFSINDKIYAEIIEY